MSQEYPPPPSGGEQPPQGPPPSYPPAAPPGGYGAPPAPPGQYPPPGGYQQYPQYPQGPQQYRQGPSGPRANFGQRLVAFIIDYIIVEIPVWLFGFLLGVSLFSFEISVDSSGEVNSIDTGAGAASAFASILYYMVSIVLPLAYYTFLEGGPTGQTLGKKAMGIRVVDMQTGGQIGYGKAIGRYFARILSAIPCFLGYFWMIWDRERQTWHDKLTNTVVVPLANYPIQR